MNQQQNYFQRNRKWLQPIARIWASPNTIFGLTLALLGWENRWQIHKGTIEILQASGPVFWICRRMGISAFTLGDCVLYSVPPCQNLRIHEGRHTRQYWLLGPFFLPLYFILMGIHGYWNHPLEQDARTIEFQQCGCLYQGSIKSKNPQ